MNTNIIDIESQSVGTKEEANKLYNTLLEAKSKGIIEVHDYWGDRAYDTYTIDEAIKRFNPINFNEQE